jgi:hypothetical protein
MESRTWRLDIDADRGCVHFVAPLPPREHRVTFAGVEHFGRRDAGAAQMLGEAMFLAKPFGVADPTVRAFDEHLACAGGNQY